MKRIISIVLALVMTAGCAVIVSADEPSSWAKDEVEAAVAAGLVPEELQKNYTAPVTRGQVAEMFIRLLEVSAGKTVDVIIEENDAVVNENAFTDTEDENVLAANALGIANGTGNDRFTPEGTLKRAHIAAIINRVAEVLGFETTGYEHGFTDITDNYSWLDEELGWPVSVGIIKGVGHNRFSPGGDLTTEQAILITYRSYMVFSSVNVLEIYVSPEGSDDPDGSPEKPYGSLTDAMESAKRADKSLYSRIDIVMTEGEYLVSSTMEFDESYSGTAECPVRIIGTEGAVIVGGISLRADDFVPAEGGLTEFFPEESRGSIVMVDLKEYGFDPAVIQKYLSGSHLFADAPSLSADGVRQTLSRFPNDDWIMVSEGMAYDYDGTPMPTLTNKSNPEYYLVKYGEEYTDRTAGWKSGERVFVRARWTHPWCPDDSYVMEFIEGTDTMKVRFAGGYEVAEKAIFYWYNIPEEMDMPGEYMFGSDAVLYYYPAEGFENAVMTVPLAGDVISLRGTDYITIENMSFTSFNGSCIHGENVRGFTFRGNLITAGSNGIKLDGVNRDILISSNCMLDMGGAGILLYAGNVDTVEDGNARIYNNYIRGWAYNIAYGYGISVFGVGIKVDHNVLHESNFKGIHVARGINVLIEYNEVYDACLLADDVGVISGDGQWANGNIVVRYNYVHDCGPVGAAAKMNYYGIKAFYYDGLSSYFTSYGNVAAHIVGGACLLNAGRGNTFIGNLAIDCNESYIDASEWGYGSWINEDGTMRSRHTTLPEYVYTDAFKAVNPEPAVLITNTEGADPMDPLVWFAPANCAVKNNWIHFNKAFRRPGFENFAVYSIEPYVYEFAASQDDFDVPRGQKTNENVSVYNSRRDTLDLKELITVTAAGVIDIDWDTFLKIGIVDSDWTIDTDVLSEIPQYR